VCHLSFFFISLVKKREYQSYKRSGKINRRKKNKFSPQHTHRQTHLHALYMTHTEKRERKNRRKKKNTFCPAPFSQVNIKNGQVHGGQGGKIGKIIIIINDGHTSSIYGWTSSSTFCTSIQSHLKNLLLFTARTIFWQPINF